jgi:hypothetical protein
MRQEVAGTAAEADAHLTLTERVAAARAALAENSERLAAAAERLRVTRYSLANGRSQREQLHESSMSPARCRVGGGPDKQGAARRLAPGLPDAKPLAAGDVPATLKRC